MSTIPGCNRLGFFYSCLNFFFSSLLIMLRNYTSIYLLPLVTFFHLCDVRANYNWHMGEAGICRDYILLQVAAKRKVQPNQGNEPNNFSYNRGEWHLMEAKLQQTHIRNWKNIYVSIFWAKININECLMHNNYPVFSSLCQ